MKMFKFAVSYDVVIDFFLHEIRKICCNPKYEISHSPIYSSSAQRLDIGTYDYFFVVKEANWTIVNLCPFGFDLSYGNVSTKSDFHRPYPDTCEFAPD